MSAPSFQEREIFLLDKIYIHCVSFHMVVKPVNIKMGWKISLKKMFCVVAHSSIVLQKSDLFSYVSNKILW